MATAVTYEGAARRTETTTGQLFAGLRLWFSQKVPSRKWLIANAENNGAIIVPLEKQADILLVDHAKKNQAPGTHSYRFVEESIRKGQLEDLNDHIVGSSARVERPVGSVRTAAKGSRTPFNAADDQLLWDWVKPYADLNGAWKGNEIFKQLERHNSRHTFQSWRDRWIKYTQYQDRQIVTQIGPAYEGEYTQDHEAVQNLLHLAAVAGASENTDQAVSTKQPHEGIRTKDSNRSVVQLAKPTGMGNEQSTAVIIPETQVHEQSETQDSTGQDIQTQPAGDLPQQDARPNVIPEDHAGSQTGNESKEKDANPAIQAPESNEQENDLVAYPDQINLRPLPLAFNFTQDIARRLYNAVPSILNTIESRLDKSWAGVMEEFPGYGDQKTWVKYFEKFIYTEFIIREGLEDEEKLEQYLLRWARAERAERAKDSRSQSGTAGARATQANDEKSDVQDLGEASESEGDEDDEDKASSQQSSGIEIQETNQEGNVQQIKDQHEQAVAYECANCFTTMSHRWRKDIQGRRLCDACGRFLKKNGVMRPSSTWTEPPDLGDVQEGQEDPDQHKEDLAQHEGDKFVPQKPDDDHIGIVGQAVSQQSVPSTILRPPVPNESRKRSQGRSTQSDSQSLPKSQSTTTSGSASDIPYSINSVPQAVPVIGNANQAVFNQSGVSPVITTGGLSPKRNREPSEDCIGSSKRRKTVLDFQSLPSKDPDIMSLVSSAIDEEDEGSNDDIVSPVRTHEQKPALLGSPELGSSEMTAAVYRDPGSSPLFFPEEVDEEQAEWLQDDASGRSKGSDGAEFRRFLLEKTVNKDESENVLPAVNLVDDEDIEIDMAANQSDYAPSEAASEGIHFEDTTPELSQAWNTAPQSTKEMDVQDDEEEDGSDELIPSTSQIEQGDVSSLPEDRGNVPRKIFIPEQGDQTIQYPSLHSNGSGDEHDNTFETAPEKFVTQLSITSSTTQEVASVSQLSNTRRLDTQVLLQQSLPTTIEETSFLIPPPDGGWESDSELEVIDEGIADQAGPHLTSIKREISTSPAPQSIQLSSESDATIEDDPEKVDQFLIDQRRLYSKLEIEDRILDGITIKALESTCMDIDLASYVVEAMVRRYVKGKDVDVPGLDGHDSPSMLGARTSHKKQSKRAIESLVDRLIPTDIPGVWTAQDDAWLQGIDARNVERVDQKHGEDGIKVRFAYLEDMYRQ